MNNFTYFLCPSSGCNLFIKINCNVPCEYDCPEKAEKMILCDNCLKEIVLEYGFSKLRRVSCPYCGASTFKLLSGKYIRKNI